MTTQKYKRSKHCESGARVSYCGMHAPLGVLGPPQTHDQNCSTLQETMGERIYAGTTEAVEVALKAPALMVCAHGTIPAVQLLLCAIKSCV